MRVSPEEFNNLRNAKPTGAGVEADPRTAVMAESDEEAPNNQLALVIEAVTESEEMKTLADPPTASFAGAVTVTVHETVVEPELSVTTLAVSALRVR